MFLARLRLLQSTPAFVICSLLLFVGLLIQINILYQSYHKKIRVEGYKQHVAELNEMMESVQTAAQRTVVMAENLDRRISGVVRAHAKKTRYKKRHKNS